jgi:hypothetical protein
MSVNFVVKKCTQCAGMLEYIKDKKIWRCLYCGAEIERQQQYDGLFTINNVVRQALNDIAFRRMKIAKEHIIEAEKIDSRYLGTTIANLAYGVISLSVPDSSGLEKSTIAQIKKYNEILVDYSSTLSEDEEVIYEFVDSSDVYATLLVVFDILNHSVRKEYLSKLIVPEEIFSVETNKTFLSYCVKNNKSDLIEVLLKNNENSDARFSFFEVLEKYADQSNKSQMLTLVSSKIRLNSNDQFRIDNYFKSSLDSMKTKTNVLEQILNQDFEIDYLNYINNVVKTSDKEAFIKNVDLITRKKKPDSVSEVLIERIFSSEYEVIIKSLDILKHNNFFLAIGSKELLQIEKSTILDSESKSKIVKMLIPDKVTKKQIEIFLGIYLNEIDNLIETRMELVSYLLKTLEQLSPKIFEKYVYDSHIDKDKKPKMMELLLKTNVNVNYFSDLMNHYINTSKDPLETQPEVIKLLLSYRFNITIDDLLRCLLIKKYSFDELVTLIKLIKNNYEHQFMKLLDIYVIKLKQNVNFDVAKHLFDSKSKISNEAIECLLFDTESSSLTKFELLIAVMNQVETDFFSQRLIRTFNNQVIDLNVTQAYMLFGKDDQIVSTQIINELSKRYTPIENIGVSNKKIKFKVFLSNNIDLLNHRSKELMSIYI